MHPRQGTIELLPLVSIHLNFVCCKPYICRHQPIIRNPSNILGAPPSQEVGVVCKQESISYEGKIVDLDEEEDGAEDRHLALGELHAICLLPLKSICQHQKPVVYQ